MHILYWGDGHTFVSSFIHLFLKYLLKSLMTSSETKQKRGLFKRYIFIFSVKTEFNYFLFDLNTFNRSPFFRTPSKYEDSWKSLYSNLWLVFPFKAAPHYKAAFPYEAHFTFKKHFFIKKSIFSLLAAAYKGKTG